jgi:hypothetical protein
MPNLTAINFVEDFTQVLEDYGDMYFAMDGGEQDMANIQATIQRQGYWSGTAERFYFDMDKLSKGVIKLLNTEERRFGV